MKKNLFIWENLGNLPKNIIGLFERFAKTHFVSNER